MSLLDRVHARNVLDRRRRVLADHVAELLPRDARVLDVGCGDGAITQMIGERRGDLELEGIEVFVREESFIPIRTFDGTSIPHDDASFDAVLFVDVLHHTDDAEVLLKEAARVTRRSVVIKDHTSESAFDHATLRFMDRTGNPPGISLPYNYWPEARWRRSFEGVGLSVAEWRSRIGLYPIPFDWVFGRGLHFIARLEVGEAAR